MNANPRPDQCRRVAIFQEFVTAIPTMPIVFTPRRNGVLLHTGKVRHDRPIDA